MSAKQYADINNLSVMTEYLERKGVELTQAEYDALVQAGTVDPLVDYHITDGSIMPVSIGNPIGTIISFMGLAAPSGYLACDGTTYNITDYSALASFFETQFGSKNYFGGDGTTTFKVPDLRGEFLRGTGTNSHNYQGAGSSVGTHQDATGLAHIVSKSDATGILVRTNTGYSSYMSESSLDSTYKRGTGTLKNVNISGTSGTTSEAYDTITVRPTNTSILYCIKCV